MESSVRSQIAAGAVTCRSAARSTVNWTSSIRNRWTRPSSACCSSTLIDTAFTGVSEASPAIGKETEFHFASRTRYMQQRG